MIQTNLNLSLRLIKLTPQRKQKHKKHPSYTYQQLFLVYKQLKLNTSILKYLTYTTICGKYEVSSHPQFHDLNTQKTFLLVGKNSLKISYRCYPCFSSSLWRAWIHVHLLWVNQRKRLTLPPFELWSLRWFE